MMRSVLLLGLALLSGPAVAQTPAPRIDWVTWRDPNEGAFTVEVPRGWSVIGGLTRPGAELRVAFDLRSPDGSMQVGIGDRSLPYFTLPVPMYTQLGMRPGTWMSPTSVLADYEPGEVFAQDYGQAVFGRACGHPVTVTGHQSAPVRQSGVPGIPNSSTTAGVAAFHCDDPAHGFFAIAMARTSLMPFQGVPGGIWSAADGVARLASASEASGATVLAVFQHVTETTRIDAAWNQREVQAQFQAALARLRAQNAGPPPGESVEAYRSRVFDEVRKGREEASDKSAANFADYIGDRQRLVDPTTGSLYVGQSGSDTYSLTPGGGVVGTLGPNVPDGNQQLDKTGN